MPKPSRYDFLAASKNLAADGALATALSCAEPGVMPAIVDALLARRRPAGLAAIVACFDRLDEVQQRRVVNLSDDLYGAFRDCCSSEDPQSRLNVISIIVKGRRPRLAYLLASLLRDSSPKVREAAALALRDLVAWFLDDTTVWIERFGRMVPDDPGAVAEALHRRSLDRRQLTDSTLAALESFDTHHHPPVVEAALWLADELGNRLWKVLEAPGGHARRAALELLNGAPGPLMVPVAIEAMGHSDFRPAVVRMLSTKHSNEIPAMWLRQEWRLMTDAIRKAFRTVKSWPNMIAAMHRLDRWDGDLQARAVRMISATGLPMETKMDLLQHMWLHGDPVARRAVAWALIDMKEPEATALLHTISREKGTPGAAAARREVKRRRREKRRHQSEAPPPVAASTQSEIDRFWGKFDTLGAAEQATQAASLLADASNLDAVLRKLASPSSTTRVRALRMLTTAGLAPAVAHAIYGLAHDRDSMVRSAAMTAIGYIPGETSEQLLRESLEHPDDRVRANAVESLDRLSAAANDPLVLERLDDEDNRTRANAAKALLKLGVRDAAETLCAMLRDPASDQRASALWVVQRLQLVPLLTRIGEMAAEDPDPGIQQQAQKLLEMLVKRSEAETAEAGLAEEVQPSIS
ncbi:MAG: HEAT repeat domain-containing protein [Phycisphaerae bacterium]|nr:HEAT repeat domain-containing protein [Phycisphaerae bacterium]